MARYCDLGVTGRAGTGSHVPATSHSVALRDRQSWHGLAPCANLAQRWRSADEDGREALRKKYGEKVMEEVQSSEWMVENTKVRQEETASSSRSGYLVAFEQRAEWMVLWRRTR